MRDKLGRKVVTRLMREHIDVTGSPEMGYSIHCVGYPEIGLEKDIYDHITCTCIEEARFEACIFLMTRLFPDEEEWS